MRLIFSLRIKGIYFAVATSLPSSVGKKNHLVLLIHGIRTQAEWQQTVSRILETHEEIRVRPTKYGFFDVVRFFLPIPWLRRPPVQRIAKLIRDGRDLEGIDRVSVIAHSYGSYIIGQILISEPDIKFERLALCGSILKDDFPWEQYPHRVRDPVVNDCGSKDIWPLLAKVLTWGYGSSGRFGFGHPRVLDRFHREKGHSDFFSEEFARTYWLPLLARGEAPAVEGDPPKAPYWLSLLTIVQPKYVALAALFLFLIVPFLPFWEPPNNPPSSGAAVSSGDTGQKTEPPEEKELEKPPEPWTAKSERENGGSRNPLSERASVLAAEIPTFSVQQNVLLDGEGKPVSTVPSPNLMSLQELRLIVVHFDAAPNRDATTSALSKEQSNASYHALISKNGAVDQLVPLDFAAWHTGKSQWKEIEGLNRYSVGISFQNRGNLKKVDGRWVTWFGTDVDPEWVFVDSSGAGWERYSKQQIATFVGVAEALIEHYPLIEDLVGHDQVSGGRRADPGPAFPLAAIRERIFRGREPTKEDNPPVDAVYFDAESGEPTEDALRQLQRITQYLKRNPDTILRLEGHTDERGTNEDNLALGLGYATTIAKILVSYGVEESRLPTLTLGEERPVCTESREACWARNRRVELVKLQPS